MRSGPKACPPSRDGPTGAEYASAAPERVRGGRPSWSGRFERRRVGDAFPYVADGCGRQRTVRFQEHRLDAAELLGTGVSAPGGAAGTAAVGVPTPSSGRGRRPGASGGVLLGPPPDEDPVLGAGPVAVPRRPV